MVSDTLTYDGNNDDNDIPQLESILPQHSQNQHQPSRHNGVNTYASHPNDVADLHNSYTHDNDINTIAYVTHNTTAAAKSKRILRSAIDIEGTYHEYSHLMIKLKIEDQITPAHLNSNTRINTRKRTNGSSNSNVNVNANANTTQTSLKSFFLLKPSDQNNNRRSPTSTATVTSHNTHNSNNCRSIHTDANTNTQQRAHATVLLDITNENDDAIVITNMINKSQQVNNHDNNGNNSNVQTTRHKNHPVAAVKQPKSQKHTNTSAMKTKQRIEHQPSNQPSEQNDVANETHQIEENNEKRTDQPTSNAVQISPNYPQLQQVIVHPYELFNETYSNSNSKDVLLQLNHNGQVITQHDNPYIHVNTSLHQVNNAREYWEYIEQVYFRKIHENDVEKLRDDVTSKAYVLVVDDELKVSEEDRCYDLLKPPADVNECHDNESEEMKEGSAAELNDEEYGECEIEYENEDIGADDQDDDSDDDNDHIDTNPYNSITSISQLLTLLDQQLQANQQIANDLYTSIINEKRHELLLGRQSYAQYLYEKQCTEYASKHQNETHECNQETCEEPRSDQCIPHQHKHPPNATTKRNKHKHSKNHNTILDVNTLSNPLQSYHDAVTEDYITYLKKQRKFKKKHAVKVSEDELGPQAKKSYTGHFNSGNQYGNGSISASNSNKELQSHMLDGEIVCHLCGNDEDDIDNHVLFCDRCDLAVHQICYGVKTIPEGDLPWYCDVCTIQIQMSKVTGILLQGHECFPSCAICSKQGGAMKLTEKYAKSLQPVIDMFYESKSQNTVTSQAIKLLQPYINNPRMLSSIEWCHLICAIYLPETYIGDPHKMTPICSISRIATARYNLKCTICKQWKKNESACVQCCVGKCTTAFHASCARDASYQMEFTEHEGEHQYVVYCERHRTEPRDRWLCCFDNSNKENVNNPYLRLTGKTVKVKTQIPKQHKQEQHSKQSGSTSNHAKQLNNRILSQLSTQIYLSSGTQQYLYDCTVCSFGLQTKQSTSSKNLLLQCSGCKIRVHQLCYGVVRSVEVLEKIRQKKWLCDVCSVQGITQSQHIQCVICNASGGAMKQTDNHSMNQYCHITCALFVPELSFVNVDSMTPITGIEKALKTRAALKCEYCHELCNGHTAAIQCSYTRCLNAFHIPCAEKSSTHLLVERSESASQRNNKGTDFIGYCSMHSTSKPALEHITRQRETESKRLEQIRGKTNALVQSRQMFGSYAASIPQKKVYTLRNIDPCEKIRLSVSKRDIRSKQVTFYYVNEEFQDTSSEEEEDEENSDMDSDNHVMLIDSESDDDNMDNGSNKKKRNVNRTNANKNNGKRNAGTSKKKNTIQQYMQQQARHNDDDSDSSSSDDEDDINKLYCLCRKRFIPGTNMICCDRCEEWYHEWCVGVVAADYGEDDPYLCPKCDPAAANKKQQEQRKYRR